MSNQGHLPPSIINVQLRSVHQLYKQSHGLIVSPCDMISYFYVHWYLLYSWIHIVFLYVKVLCPLRHGDDATLQHHNDAYEDMNQITGRTDTNNVGKTWKANI